MSSGLAGISVQHGLYPPLAVSPAMSGVRGSLNQQKQDGQAALKLIESAVLPIDPDIGQNIDVYA
ncbi:MAG: hypothetical protein V2I50_09505 [Desulfuromusa sp.]|nr:hypothetical protein [Desulfuromusa sp.]